MTRVYRDPLANRVAGSTTKNWMSYRPDNFRFFITKKLSTFACKLYEPQNRSKIQIYPFNNTERPGKRVKRVLYFLSILRPIQFTCESAQFFSYEKPEITRSITYPIFRGASRHLYHSVGQRVPGHKEREYCTHTVYYEEYAILIYKRILI